jgi:DNA-binding LacI/PurR family transcriptional regulator
MSTIKDVAREAGVTSATVSYVLNNTGRVSETTRQRVLAAATHLNYRPSITAQNLRAGQSRIIGYAWHLELPGERSVVMQQFLYTMSLAAERAGYHVLTFVADSADPVSSYLQLADTGRVDGFVLAYTNRDDPRIRHLLDLQIPFASFGRANDDWDFPYVDVDGANGMSQAVNHLLDRGHRRIGLITWQPSSLTGEYRCLGYRQALEQAGISFDPRWQVYAENTTEAGFQAAQELMTLPPALRPTAIACVSDIIAIGAMQFLSQSGYRVGPDVAVTGFDDIPTSALLTPALTSVHQPLDEVGDRVVGLLLEMLRGTPPRERHLLLQPRLIVRESSEGGPA